MIKAEEELIEEFAGNPVNYKIPTKKDEYLKAINELKATGRFYIYDYIHRASTVYENSKIVISMPFTSVVIEALCAGKKSFFIEFANVFDHWYGTPKDFIEKNLNNGQDVIFDIDWQGA